MNPNPNPNPNLKSNVKHRPPFQTSRIYLTNSNSPLPLLPDLLRRVGMVNAVANQVVTAIIRTWARAWIWRLIEIPRSHRYTMIMTTREEERMVLVYHVHVSARNPQLRARDDPPPCHMRMRLNGVEILPETGIAGVGKSKEEEAVYHSHLPRRWKVSRSRLISRRVRRVRSGLGGRRGRENGQARENYLYAMGMSVEMGFLTGKGIMNLSLFQSLPNGQNPPIRSPHPTRLLTSQPPPIRHTTLPANPSTQSPPASNSPGPVPSRPPAPARSTINPSKSFWWAKRKKCSWASV